LSTGVGEIWKLTDGATNWKLEELLRSNLFPHLVGVIQAFPSFRTLFNYLLLKKRKPFDILVRFSFAINAIPEVGYGTSLVEHIAMKLKVLTNSVNTFTLGKCKLIQTSGLLMRLFAHVESSLAFPKQP
jgi:hypothetical protein